MTNGYLPRPIAAAVRIGTLDDLEGDVAVLPEPGLTLIERMRYQVARAALQGLLAATPATTQATANADAYAKRAVRYADALLDALNHSHQEVRHASHR